ncbi:hypothetical protein QVM62_20845 [Pseudomonas putida]|uniref:hypothetical protein n=1 Tax=Pseudomonas TaxID=286 RepID=UPI0035267175
MLERIGHIKNPLTVIAIFAGIAEVFGTIVLPFVDSEVQPQFVSFLTAFPFFLVFLFFVTLWWNHRVLYAPSDYREERNFMHHFLDEGSAELRKRKSVNLSDLSVEIGTPNQPDNDSQIEPAKESSDQKEDKTASDSSAESSPAASINDDSLPVNSPEPESIKPPEKPSTDGYENLAKKIEHVKKNGSKIFKPDTTALIKYIVAHELAGDFDAEFKINVSPKSFPNAIFDIVIQSPKHYGIAQIISGDMKLADSLSSMAMIRNFYNTLSDSEQARFFARIVLMMQPMEKISEDERRKFVAAVQEMPFLLEIEERYSALNQRRMMEIS